jgi:hypothetical protein
MPWSSTSARWMKKTCSPLSRPSANSSARERCPSRPARPASWYQASSDGGTDSWHTVRTSALSMPMPNAFVATMTSTSPSMNARWVSVRSSRRSPAW